ncbi:MAG: ribbon-helix-helix protein, CopG family [Acidobacteria bacterium]|nr:ribbon-helix-helix protein, CopG family [Acidobacteriota bacterium]MYH29013.1 ribbon-helix-helix protein, CopG family [Acidobacteriota bacterium]MYK89800.1 ribbon-helix-helix protein, CopG family [Acidobacteriota bacterium]
MATTTIKTTYSLDVESVRALEELAGRWGVSKSEALRRAIRSEAGRQPARGGDALAALDQLQASLRARNIDLDQWAREVESERQAAGRRLGSETR